MAITLVSDSAIRSNVILGSVTCMNGLKDVFKTKELDVEGFDAVLGK